MTAKRRSSCQVAIVGAGPYGLSVAAHLKHAGISTHVFGEPMSFWRNHMPKGMRLRSPWRATHLSSPDRQFSLDAYATTHGVEQDRPLPIAKFVAYGEWFQGHVAPDVDRRAVHRIDAVDNGFDLELADGETFAADRVVIATGLANQDYRPRLFRDLPAALVTHTCEHTDSAPFRGKRVAVKGRGQSACESAALLAEAGAEVDIISRGDIHWLGASNIAPKAQKPGFWLNHYLEAPSAVGPFPLSWLAEMPTFTHHWPLKLRDHFTTRCLKAGAAGWLVPRFKDVECSSGRTISGVRAVSGRVVIDLDGGSQTFDHVLLGTGYRVDLSRVGVLAPRLLEKVVRVEGSPMLGTGFESSVPKLHFVGSYAVRSFGPLMRFIAGTAYAARAVTRGVLVDIAQRAVSEFPGTAAPPLRGAAPTLSRPR